MRLVFTNLIFGPRGLNKKDTGRSAFAPCLLNKITMGIKILM